MRRRAYLFLLAPLLLLAGGCGYDSEEMEVARLKLWQAVGADEAEDVAAPAPVVHGADRRVIWALSVWGRSRPLTAGIERLADRVLEETGGKFTIDIHYDAALSAPADHLRGLSSGRFEAAVTCLGLTAGATPIAAGLDLPFLPFEDLDRQARVQGRLLRHHAVQAELAAWNAALLMPMPMPPVEFVGRGLPPREAGDWRGLRVAASGGVAAALSALGAYPVAVAYRDLRDALAAGDVDAVALPYAEHVTAGTHEAASWYTAGWSPGAPSCPLLMAESAWQALPEHYRRALTAALGDAHGALAAAMASAEVEAVRRFANRELIPINYPPALRAEFAAMAKPLWDSWLHDVEARQLSGRTLLRLMLEPAG